MGQGFLIIEASQSHSDTPHLLGLLWTSDQLVAEAATYTTHNKHKTGMSTNIHALGGTRNRHLSNQVAAGLRLRPYRHRDRRLFSQAEAFERKCVSYILPGTLYSITAGHMAAVLLL